MSVERLGLSNTCQLIKGRPIADAILADVERQVSRLAEEGRRLRLVSIIFGDPGPAQVYVRNQRLAATRVGIEFIEMVYPSGISEPDALATLRSINSDPAVTGIILQRPLPPHLSIKRLQCAIPPQKDVEGMHAESIGEIVYGLTDIGPCTALAAIEMLRQTGVPLKGMEIVVIGHSEIVGKPIAFLLMAEGATVTVCHHMTRSVMMHARRADAIFVAVGKPRLLRANMIKPGAVVIDIGINAVVDEHGRSRIVGDVDFDEATEVAGWLTPVPGGVGPVTVSILMRNTVFAAKRQQCVPTTRFTYHKFSRDFSWLDRFVVCDMVARTGVDGLALEHRAVQTIRIKAEIAVDCSEGRSLGADFDGVASRIRSMVEKTQTDSMEDLAEDIAAQCRIDDLVHSVSVSIEKLSAAEGAAK